MFLPIVKWPKIFWTSAQRKQRWYTLVGLSAFAAALGIAYAVHQPDPPQPWSDAELRAIGSLRIGALPPLPKDPTNAVADHPLAQRLGHRLFFDARLSANGAVSCATCHKPERRFTDGLARAVGLSLGNFNTPSLVGAAYSPWQFWNGRADSLWAQAASPLENPLGAWRQPRRNRPLDRRGPGLRKALSEPVRTAAGTAQRRAGQRRRTAGGHGGVCQRRQGSSRLRTAAAAGERRDSTATPPTCWLETSQGRPPMASERCHQTT